MRLSWYGTASILLEEEGYPIAFDPFGGIRQGEMRHPPEVLPYQQELRTAREVFVTHGHFDHIYHLPRLYKGTDIPIYCTATPAGMLARKGIAPEQLHEIAAGWQGAAGPFTLRAYPSRHCRFDAPLVRRTVLRREFFRYPEQTVGILGADLAYRENGEILFYDVTGKEGRVQVMGSMNLDRDTDYPVGADALILPLQGRSDQDTYAMALVERLGPKAVFLDHYDNTFPPLTGEVDPWGFIRNVERSFQIPCVPLKRGERVSIGGAGCPEEIQLQRDSSI